MTWNVFGHREVPCLWRESPLFRPCCKGLRLGHALHVCARSSGTDARMAGRTSSNLSNHKLVPAEVGRCRCHRLGVFLLRTRTATSCAISFHNMHALDEPLQAYSWVCRASSRHSEEYSTLSLTGRPFQWRAVEPAGLDRFALLCKSKSVRAYRLETFRSVGHVS